MERSIRLKLWPEIKDPIFFISFFFLFMVNINYSDITRDIFYRWNFISNKKSMEDGKEIDHSIDVSFIINIYKILFFGQITFLIEHSKKNNNFNESRQNIYNLCLLLWLSRNIYDVLLFSQGIKGGKFEIVRRPLRMQLTQYYQEAGFSSLHQGECNGVYYTI